MFNLYFIIIINRLFIKKYTYLFLSKIFNKFKVINILWSYFSLSSNNSFCSIIFKFL